MFFEELSHTYIIFTELNVFRRFYYLLANFQKFDSTNTLKFIYDYEVYCFHSILN